MFTLFLRFLFLALVIGGVWWWVFVMPQTDSSEKSSQGIDVVTQLEEVVESSQEDNVTGEEITRETSEQIEVINDVQIDDDVVIVPTPEKILHAVPFVAQAPLAQWEDERFQDACEEASILMAMLWVRDQKSPGKKDASQALEDLFVAEQNFFPGNPLDTSTEDTARFALAHLDLNVEYRSDISQEEIIAYLADNKIIIAPTNGKALGNPYFSSGGPDRHMLVIRGYNKKQNLFITNDPGTKRGEKYAYDADILYEAIRDYKTGYHEPLDTSPRKNVIIVSR